MVRCMPASFLATRKSLSSLRTHAAVSFFIQYHAPGDNLTQEPVSLFQPPANTMGSVDDQIQGKAAICFFQNPHGLVDLIICRHYHKDVRIAVLVRLAVGVEAEQIIFSG